MSKLYQNETIYSLSTVILLYFLNKPYYCIVFFKDFEPVAYPVNDYGKFYTGDSYIVLNVRMFSNNLFK